MFAANPTERYTSKPFKVTQNWPSVSDFLELTAFGSKVTHKWLQSDTNDLKRGPPNGPR